MAVPYLQGCAVPRHAMPCHATPCHASCPVSEVLGLPGRYHMCVPVPGPVLAGDEAGACAMAHLFATQLRQSWPGPACRIPHTPACLPPASWHGSVSPRHCSHGTAGFQQPGRHGGSAGSCAKAEAAGTACARVSMHVPNNSMCASACLCACTARSLTGDPEPACDLGTQRALGWGTGHVPSKAGHVPRGQNMFLVGQDMSPVGQNLSPAGQAICPC